MSSWYNWSCWRLLWLNNQSNSRLNFAIKAVRLQQIFSLCYNFITSLSTKMKTFFVIGIALVMVHAAFSCICTKPKPGEEVCGSDGKTCKKNLLFCKNSSINIHF